MCNATAGCDCASKNIGLTSLRIVRFSATSADVKKRIESLIERDYLERDPDDNSIYNYLA